ncbi:hypothetical protein [Sphingobacterium sp. CZ-2]|uniref:hypothetical protein n=1 Tax=Sphingobacterium sp. CZ-2 TaxID=2557994 RepID=UPI00106FB6AA|nr:hypothetical protein [Sphingobacterium sp. CZ-2]QBR13457.1 hypothetical protein E3D81_15250 [Sphingobacterium sp. CZ-2]
MYSKVKYFGILFSFLLLGTLMVQAQEQGKVISGLLMEKGSNIRVSDANVVNLRSKQSVRSSAYGVFTIDVIIGDTIRVSKVGYGPVKTVIHSLDDILIDMQSGTTIETVVVTRSTKEAELNSFLKEYEKKGVYNGGHNRVSTYLNSPATALYNLFGKDAKNAKRFERYMNQELEASKVDRVFNKAIVNKITNLEGDELQSFMDLYRPSISSVERWGEYDLLNYIQNSFKTWDAQGRPKSQRLPKLEIPPQEK